MTEHPENPLFYSSLLPESSHQNNMEHRNMGKNSFSKLIGKFNSVSSTQQSEPVQIYSWLIKRKKKSINAMGGERFKYVAFIIIITPRLTTIIKPQFFIAKWK